MNNKLKTKGSVYFNAVQLIIVGSITGIFAGVIVTLYNVCASYRSTFNRLVYSKRSDKARANDKGKWYSPNRRGNARCNKI